MKVAITDANIFIDLHDLGCLSWFELLGLEVYTTSLVLNELGVVQRMAVQKIVGVVTELTMDEVDSLALLPLPAGLSEADKSVIWQTQQLKNTPLLILSGDNLMRNWCLKNQLEVHGILWMFDQLILQTKINHATARHLLTQLMRINQWLPSKACIERLEKWGESD